MLINSYFRVKVSFTVLVVLSFVVAEPPSPVYGVPAYVAPSGLSQGYFPTSAGHQSTEGLDLDPHLLHKIKEILIAHEEHEPSRTYLPAVYGAPHHGYNRVVGIDFQGIRPGLQVAHYHQTGYEASAHHHHHHYAPSHGYLPPSNEYLPPSPGYLPPPIPLTHYGPPRR